jgi:MraZ protein
VAVDQETSGPVVADEHPRGLFQARVDNKGRVKLPAAFQKYFDARGVKQFYITTRDERLVYICPLELWKEKERILDNPPTEELFELYESVRFIVDKYGGDATIDGEGRLLLSQELRKKFELADAPVWLQFKKDAIQMYNETEYKRRESEVTQEKLAKAAPSLAMKGF